MSDSRYFVHVDQIQVKDPVVRARFIFSNNNGQSLIASSATGQYPIGISYFTQIPTACGGYAKYYNMGVTLPVRLELAESITVGKFLTFDGLGRGVKAIPGNTAYAQSIQGGDSGDYVWVHPKVMTVKYMGDFNNDFSSDFSQ